MKREEIERLLPEVFQRTADPGSPLWAILDLMEGLHQPTEEALATLESFFSPHRAPEPFVPFLARWVDLDRFFTRGAVEEDAEASSRPPISTGLGRLRELVAAAAHLSQWRGTGHGLKLFLETATGIRGFELDEDNLDAEGFRRPFHVAVRAPAEAAAHRTLIERIIEQEKPAYVTYELSFSS